MFGRREQYDPRNENFPFRLALVAEPEPTTWPVWAMFYKPLNQMNTGTCVGHGGKHFMLIAPTIQTKPGNKPTAFDLYAEACKRDIWPENDNGDLQFGTSVLALFKAMKDLGIIGSYVHTRTVDDIRMWLKTKGPVIVGFNWYSSMMDTNKQGFCRIEPTAHLVGGHCVTLKYWSKKHDAPVFINSWGNRFGPRGNNGEKTGYGIFTPEDLQRLLNEGGDATAAVEQKLVV